VLKARAVDMVGREEMDCGMVELAEPAFLVLKVCEFLPAGLGRIMC
jgi:hypothetical protein